MEENVKMGRRYYHKYDDETSFMITPAGVVMMFKGALLLLPLVKLEAEQFIREVCEL